MKEFHSKTSKRPKRHTLQYIQKIFSVLLITLALVCTLERRYALALIFIQCMHRHSPIANIDLAMRHLLPSQGVLHPVIVIAVGVVFTGVRAA